MLVSVVEVYNDDFSGRRFWREAKQKLWLILSFFWVQGLFWEG